MPAWTHYNRWYDANYYDDYRYFVSWHAPSLARHPEYKKQDCADLSMLLLIQFAADNHLTVELQDNNGRRYRSEEEGGGSLKWRNQTEFYQAVKQRIGASSLHLRNTVPSGQTGKTPRPGDLLLNSTHCAIVFAVYAPGVPHPRWDDQKLPSFPGPDKAMADFNGQEYFKGTTVPYPQDVTAHRGPDDDYHFDYLNSRGNAKRNAELIYFANARQAVEAGFSFREYAPQVRFP